LIHEPDVSICETLNGERWATQNDWQASQAPPRLHQAAKLVIDIASGECRDTWQEREGPMLNSIELPEHTQRNLFGFQAN
jgi:hypothetical protein